MFIVPENSSSYNGFIYYEVYSEIIYDSKKASLESFDGFKITGSEIDYYFPPYQAFKLDISFNKTSGAIENMVVECPDITNY